MRAIATHIVIPLSKMVKKFAFLVDFCPFLKKSHPSPKICSADVRKNFTFFNINFLGINRESKLMTTSLSGKTLTTEKEIHPDYHDFSAVTNKLFVFV